MRQFHGFIAACAVVAALPCVASAASIAPDRNTYVVGADIRVTYDTPTAKDFPSPWIGMYPKGKGNRITYQNVKKGRGVATFKAPGRPGQYDFRLTIKEKQVLSRATIRTVVPPTPGAIRLSKRSFTIGERIEFQVNVPAGRRLPRPWVGLFNKGKRIDSGSVINDSRRTYQYVAKGKPLVFIAPEWPGVYEFRLYDRDGSPYKLDSATFEVKAPPARGAMKLAKRLYTVGEPVTMDIDLPGGRHYGRAYVGMFTANREAQGGALRPGRRLTYQYLGKKKKLSFTAPAWPGRYVFRLFDRDGDNRHLLDTISFDVEVPPARGAMKLAKQLYTVGEPVTMDIDLPGGRYYGRAYVAMFTAHLEAPGGTLRPGRRLTYQYLGKKKKLTFTAPAWPGRYIFRLFDRDGDARYLLDTISFEVEVPPVPGAMKLAKQLYTVGERVTLDIDLPGGRYYGRAYAGMFSANNEAPGGAMRLGNRSTYQYLGKKKKLTFTAPAWPGRYEFRLYDRDGDTRYLLDKISFDVEVPPVPGAMKLAKRRFIIGEKVPMDVDLPGGRYYGRAYVALYKANNEVPGGAMRLGSRSTYQYLGKKKKLTFTAPAWPGRYEFLLYDRDGDARYLLDKISIDIEAPPVLGALSVTPGSVRVGGKVSVSVSVPSGRVYPKLWVGLYATGEKVPGGASHSERRLSSERVKAGKPMTFVAPKSVGQYEFRLFDRDGRQFILDAAALAVTDPANPSRPGAVDRETPLPKGTQGDSSGTGGDPLKNGGETGAKDPEKDAPALRFVRREGGAWSAIAGALPFGQRISAEARFRKPPDEESLEAELNVPGGGTRTVTLRRTDDPNVFRSGPFILSVPKEGPRL